jgi:hypothetical protein
MHIYHLPIVKDKFILTNLVRIYSCEQLLKTEENQDDSLCYFEKSDCWFESDSNFSHQEMQEGGG